MTREVTYDTLKTTLHTLNKQHWLILLNVDMIYERVFSFVCSNSSSIFDDNVRRLLGDGSKGWTNIGSTDATIFVYGMEPSQNSFPSLECGVVSRPLVAVQYSYVANLSISLSLSLTHILSLHVVCRGVTLRSDAAPPAFPFSLSLSQVIWVNTALSMDAKTIYLSISMYVCMHACMHVCIYVLYVCMYVSM